MKDYKATFVLYDLQDHVQYVYNPLLAAERLSPCSTFKIANAAIALETGVLTGPDHLLKWDGRERWLAAWNKDHTLQSAMRVSTVWYFQAVARSIGAQTMQRYVDALQYGNRDLSAGIDVFWLGTSIEISAVEQIEFLRKLYLDELPFKRETMAQVRELLVLEQNQSGIFSGKTGTGWDPVAQQLTHGWFVGHVASIHGNYLFALNIQDGPDSRGPNAKVLTRKILDQLGIYGLSEKQKGKPTG